MIVGSLLVLSRLGVACRSRQFWRIVELTIPLQLLDLCGKRSQATLGSLAGGVRFNLLDDLVLRMMCQTTGPPIIHLVLSVQAFVFFDSAMATCDTAIPSLILNEMMQK